jgi:hypothetical protein
MLSCGVDVVRQRGGRALQWRVRLRRRRYVLRRRGGGLGEDGIQWRGGRAQAVEKRTPVVGRWALVREASLAAGKMGSSGWEAFVSLWSQGRGEHK